MMRSLLCIMLLCYVTYVSCNSSGLNIPCDVDYPYLGALGGVRIMDPTAQKASGRNMTWSLAPVFAGTKYTLTTDTGATTYTPGQYTTLVLRTNVQDQQFTGLLLYAVNSAGAKVGSWLIAPRQNYQIDPKTGCVTHNNADPKNYKSIFRVQFPAGTGTVTIKALVKFGLAFPEARGAFYWPNSQHLQLTEGTAQQQQWFQGVVGQSCNTVCAKQNLGCDSATLTSAGSAATLLATVAKTTGCFGPMMKGCGANSPTFGTEGCFYHDPTCTRDPVTFDPCAGVAPYQPGVNYDPSKGQQCVTYTDSLGLYKWCASYYTSSAPNAAQMYGPWWRVVQCAPTGGYTTVGGAARAAVATVDCASVSDSASDGNRMCACSNGMPVSTATDPPVITTAPPTAPPTVPAPTNPPTTIPTLPTCTDAPTQAPSGSTTAPTTTVAPTSAVPDIIQLLNGPTTIPSTGSFSIKFQYTAISGSRTLAADILEPGNNYKYWGGGYTNVAAGTMGTASVTINMQGNPPSKSGYVINYFIVDQATYANGNNPDAWKFAIGMIVPFAVSVSSTATAPTAGPVTVTTMAPSSAPTSAPTMATMAPTTPVGGDGCVEPAATTAPTSTPTTPVSPNGAGGKSPNSAAQSTPTLLLTMLAVGMTGFTSRSSSMILVCALLCMSMMPSISAHNWLSSPARANDGGQGQFNGYTNPSCPPKTGRTHVQVAAGQRFPVEWATGHGFNMNSFTYLVLIKAQDEASLDLISKDSQQSINTYLTGGSNTYMPDEKVIHVTPNGPAEAGRYYLDYANSAATTALLKPLRQNPWPQGGAVFKAAGAGITFYNKTAVGMAKDMRVQYFNPQYPYIISAHKFMVSDDRADEMDWVMMEIPKGFPAGQYVLQYQWSGYYDCVDINVLDLPVVADVWGQKGPGANVYAKFHHTSYTPYLNGYSVTTSQSNQKACMEVTDSTPGNLLSDCQSMCNNANYLVSGSNNNVQCDALTVAPAQLNTAIVKFPGLHKGNTSHLPATCDSVLTSLKNPIATAQVCFIQKSGLPPSVGPATKTVLDPEDPTFYYTTYKQQGNWVFQQTCTTCNPPQPTSDFRFADQCISCADMQRNFFSGLTPVWNIASTCQHCDNRLG